MGILLGILVGIVAWFLVRYLAAGLYTVDQNELAVKTSFGRAQRIGESTTLTDPISESLNAEERERYSWPQVRVIGPGGPYFRWPWERVHKVSMAVQTMNMATDPEAPSANAGGTILDAVTKDQLNTGLQGQIRYRVSERNLYAYLFGVKHPIAHVMGFFVSVLRERIASFAAPSAGPLGAPPIVAGGASTAGAVAMAGGVGSGAGAGSGGDRPGAGFGEHAGGTAAIGISINDLRKNLRDLNELMDRECASSTARYGIVLDASLITGIDPPSEVESALAAINTAYNQVSSDISLAQASADQTLVQSRTAVEIETLKAEAEIEPLRALAEQLTHLKEAGPGALEAYRRNVRLTLFNQARRAILEVRP